MIYKINKESDKMQNRLDNHGLKKYFRLFAPFLSTYLCNILLQNQQMLNYG